MTFKIKDGISIAGSTFVDSSRNVTANTLSSAVATGTAPLTITSTTKVTNLNAEMVDGAHTDTAYNSFGNGTIPIRHSSGYLFSNYFNMTADVTTTSPSHLAVATGSDGYLRWQTPAQFKTNLSLNNVENTALSTWAGSANITTLGTITTGTWSGTAIALNKLAASTISGVSLGNNLNTLTLNVSGTGLSGSTTYNGSAAATFTVTSNATSANTASTIVARDASGNFSAGTITATLSGNASTATTLQTARTLTIGSTGKTFNGSADVAWSLAEIGAAATSHTHTTLTSSGAITAETLTADAPAGLTMRLAYTNGYPTSYGNVISLGGQGHGQIFIGWSGTSGAHADNYIRSQRDTADANWSAWAKIWTDANDGSGSGLDADLLDGLHIHTGTNNEANKIVRTDANGYIQAGWINTTSGDNGTTAISRVYASQDGYIRYYTLANFGAQLTNLNASNLASGTVATARLGSGTASASTYLRGDNTWAPVSGGVSKPEAFFMASF